MNFPKISERKFIISILIANLLLRFFRLDFLKTGYFDESAYYLKAVNEILAGKIDPNYPHPPLAKELIALAVWLVGDRPLAWRGLQALLASLAVVAVYFIAKRLFQDRLIASLSALLLTFELSWFVLSRVAIPEMFMISFFTFSLFFFIKFYQQKDNPSLILGSIFFGLALACKWAPLIFLPILLFIFFRKLRLDKVAKIQVLTIAGLIVVVSYLVPFFLMPHRYSVNDIVSFHKKTIAFHLVEEKKKVTIEPSIANSAVFWPVEVYIMRLRPTTNDNVNAVILFYNPIILWIGLVLAFFKIKQFAKNRKLNKEMFLVASFLIFWLVWFVATRDTYPYYWAIGIPFATILVAKFFSEKIGKYKWEVGGILTLGLLIFVLYYPIMTNWPVKAWYLQLLTGIGTK